jgi:ethanolamine utilization microcompartment shell protein EutS
MTDGKCGRNADGTFGIGNSGKPRGTRHKATQAVLGLLEGQAEALTQRAVEMALGGDSVALRLCLDRIAPPRKDIPVQFALPHMATAQDAAQAAGAVLAAVADGDLTPTEGAVIMGFVDAFRRTLEVTELEARVAALEALG